MPMYTYVIGDGKPVLFKSGEKCPYYKKDARKGDCKDCKYPEFVPYPLDEYLGSVCNDFSGCSCKCEKTIYIRTIKRVRVKMRVIRD